MKQPKRPTYEQKKLIAKEGLDWHEWMVEYQIGSRMVIIHKETKERRPIGGDGK